MSSKTIPSRLPVEWQHLSHLRGFEYTWSLRDDVDAPDDVRAAAVSAIRELAVLIVDLRAARRRIVEELAVFDKRDSRDSARIGARVTVHRDLIFFLPGQLDKTAARDAVTAVVRGSAEPDIDWIVDYEMPRIPSVRVTESPNEIAGVTS